MTIATYTLATRKDVKESYTKVKGLPLMAREQGEAALAKSKEARPELDLVLFNPLAE